MFDNKTIAVIGGGVMGTALMKGMLNKQILQPEQVIATDPNAARLKVLKAELGVRTHTDNEAAAREAHIIMLCVKPQIIDKVMIPLRGRVDAVEMVISIAAGVRMKTLTRGLLNSRVVRAMPNTPAQIGEGVTVWTTTPEIDERQRAQAAELLGATGQEIYVTDEKFLDMATALSGTGPAYVFLFMEAMIDAGVHLGFSRHQAEQLVLQTFRGSVDYAIASNLHPAQLRNQVTSPGGTTASALYALERGGLRTVFSDGVWAAFNRAVELGSQDEHDD